MSQFYCRWKKDDLLYDVKPIIKLIFKKNGNLQVTKYEKAIISNSAAYDVNGKKIGVVERTVFFSIKHFVLWASKKIDNRPKHDCPSFYKENEKAMRLLEALEMIRRNRDKLGE